MTRDTSNYKYLMKMVILATFIVAPIYLKASEIDCSDGGCSPDGSITVTAVSGTSTFSTLWISSFIDSLLEVITPNGSVPRDNKLYVRNGDKTKNLSIGLSSSLPNVSGGNSVIISDIFNFININNSGNSGNNGKNSTQICADSFKAGDYGPASTQFWTDRDGMLDQNNCVATDIDYIDAKFSCPVGYTEKSSGAVNVTRIEQKKKCSALYNQSRCVRRTYNVSCKLGIVRNVCGNQIYSISDNGAYYISKPFGMVFNASECIDLPSSLKLSGDSLTISYRVDEKKLNSFPSKSSLCNDLIFNTPRFEASYDYNYIDNGIPKVSHIQIADAEFIDGSVKRAFYWPLPDNIIDSKGDNIAPNDIRVILKSWDVAGLKNLKTYGNPRKEIANCMGLDGSAIDDFECDRIPGPAFSITYSIMDKYGRISKDMTVNIPEGRKRPVYLLKYSISYGADPMTAYQYGPYETEYFYGTPYTQYNLSLYPSGSPNFPTYFQKGYIVSLSNYVDPDGNGGEYREYLSTTEYY